MVARAGRATNRPSRRIIPPLLLDSKSRVAEIELEEAKVNLQLAQLELARATELLRQRTIRSPIKGIVVAGMLGPGEYAFDQAQLVTISQIDPLNVEVFVPLSHRSIAKRLISVSSRWDISRMAKRSCCRFQPSPPSSAWRLLRKSDTPRP